MGFLDKIFSGFARNTYRGICRVMINSYNKVKQQNPDASKRELYALALSMRPTWKRENLSSFTFTKGSHKLTIEEKDTFKDVVRNVIILETAPPAPYEMPLFIASHMKRGGKFMINYFKEVGQVIEEEFKDFKE